MFKLLFNCPKRFDSAGRSGIISPYRFDNRLFPNPTPLIMTQSPGHCECIACVAMSSGVLKSLPKIRSFYPEFILISNSRGLLYTCFILLQGLDHASYHCRNRLIPLGKFSGGQQCRIIIDYQNDSLPCAGIILIVDGVWWHELGVILYTEFRGGKTTG